MGMELSVLSRLYGWLSISSPGEGHASGRLVGAACGRVLPGRGRRLARAQVAQLALVPQA